MTPDGHSRRTKLASVSVGNGREAAIWRDEFGRTDWSPGVSVAALRPPPMAQPWVVPVPDGTLAAGDLLPDAQRVEVRGPCTPRDVVVAGRQFLAVFPCGASQGEVFVLCRDRAGEIVPWREPGELQRRRIADARASCPACDGRDWDIVEHRAQRQDSHARRRAVVCATCGYSAGGEEAVGQRRRRGRLEADPFVAAVGLGEHMSVAQLVQAATFPIYGLTAPAAGRAALHSHASEGKRLLKVTVSYQRRRRGEHFNVQLTTRVSARGESEKAPDPRAALQDAVRGELWKAAEAAGGKLSFEAARLRRDEFMRPIAARIRRTPAQPVDIRVDGEPREFAYAIDRETGWWAAEAKLREQTVTVVARGLKPSDAQLGQI